MNAETWYDGGHLGIAIDGGPFTVVPATSLSVAYNGTAWALTDNNSCWTDTTYATWSLFLVNLMHEAGVPIGAGTDTPISFAAPGYSLHSELEMLVRAGLSPMEALEAATVRPAEFFGLSGEMGTIEEGRLADLVLLSRDPLDDITNTRSVQAVVSKGELLSREELDALVR